MIKLRILMALKVDRMLFIYRTLVQIFRGGYINISLYNKIAVILKNITEKVWRVKYF